MQTIKQLYIQEGNINAIRDLFHYRHKASILGAVQDTMVYTHAEWPVNQSHTVVTLVSESRSAATSERIIYLVHILLHMHQFTIYNSSYCVPPTWPWKQNMTPHEWVYTNLNQQTQEF